MSDVHTPEEVAKSRRVVRFVRYVAFGMVFTLVVGQAVAPTTTWGAALVLTLAIVPWIAAEEWHMHRQVMMLKSTMERFREAMRRSS